jgi:hypothetical protein
VKTARASRLPIWIAIATACIVAIVTYLRGVVIATALGLVLVAVSMIATLVVRRDSA